MRGICDFGLQRLDSDCVAIGSIGMLGLNNSRRQACACKSTAEVAGKGQCHNRDVTLLETNRLFQPCN
jgi:hypothetical protein